MVRTYSVKHKSESKSGRDAEKVEAATLCPENGFDDPTQHN